MNVLEKAAKDQALKSDLKETIQHNHLEGNAALDRLKSKLNIDHKHTGEAITSYDRMHHRHNRS